ncbi:MAG: fanconi-associated nuclease 1 [Myxococcota bacterium]
MSIIPSPLEADYYRLNFLLILDTVESRDPHLFSPEEQELFRQLRALPLTEQCLYVRLFNRRGPLFRLDKLQYSEIPSPFESATRLCSAGFATLFQPTHPEKIPLLPTAPPLDLAAALDAYTVPELKTIARPLGLSGTDRGKLLLALLSLPPEQLSTHLLSFAPLLGLQQTPLFQRVQRLFFLNEWQDASTLVTSHLALIRYPETPCLRSRPVFETRTDFEDWLLAENLHQQLQQDLFDGLHTEAERLGQQALERFITAPPRKGDFLDRFSARDVYARSTLHWIQAHENTLGRAQAAHLYTRALDAHLPARMRGTAWQRLALHWEQLGWLEAALAACQQGLAEPQLPQYARLELLRRFERLQQRLLRQQTPSLKKSRRRSTPATPSDILATPSDIPATPSDIPATPSDIPATPSSEQTLEPPLPPPLQTWRAQAALALPSEEELHQLRLSERLAAPQREVLVRRPLLHSSVGARMKFADAEGSAIVVEEIALQAYRAAGAEGIYTENGFFTTLTTLLCWDIFFAPVPDVFQSRYQDAPLDLNQEGFFERRRPLIEARLLALEAEPLRFLHEHHQRYLGLAARGVLWEKFPLPMLEQGTQALGGKTLAGILRFLLEDHRTRRRGFPDLLLWQDIAPPSCTSPQAIQQFWGEEGYDTPASVWFAEVKSPRDRLSPEQRAWMSLLRSLGLHVEVCRVAEPTP